MNGQVLSMIAQSSEFENVAMRDDELLELDTLARQACPCDVRGGAENKHGKVNIPLQVRRESHWMTMPSHSCWPSLTHDWQMQPMKLCWHVCRRPPLAS